MKRLLTRTALTAAILAAFCGTASAWTKTYVVEWNEAAMYYGAKTGVTDPGTDCPKGSNPEIDQVKLLEDGGYTPAEAKWLRDPANPSRSAVHGQNQMAFRGKGRANVYIHPETTPDHGWVGVSGKIAEGIDLDGNASTGFTSPTGEKGIDNTFYKTLGCWKTYRGPRRLSSGALTFNDSMREGSWTVVIVITGNGDDPMNDNNVDVGFYMSGDKLVKDGNGEIARDYTFRIKPDAKFEALFKAQSKKGVITSKAATDEVWLRDPSYTGELQLLRARVSLTMEQDGSLKGYVGGYRPWKPVYDGWVKARGPVIESLTWVRLPDVYYALKRNADYSPTGPGGEKSHISYAERVEAVPAFVMTPDASKPASKIVSYQAIAPAAEPPKKGYAIDGLVPDPKVPFGQSLSVYPVPAKTTSASAPATPTAGRK
ncbi:MAG: hypothetical protein ABI740_00295 [Alphaproteobacteria bacterium]